MVLRARDSAPTLSGIRLQIPSSGDLCWTDSISQVLLYEHHHCKYLSALVSPAAYTNLCSVPLKSISPGDSLWHPSSSPSPSSLMAQVALCTAFTLSLSQPSLLMGSLSTK